MRHTAARVEAPARRHSLYVGTAGWSVPSRHAAGFPAAGSHLQRYSASLNAVEINSSFYRAHQRKTYERWAGTVPDHFRFAVKVPKVITHEHRLEDCGNALDQFIGEVGGLGGKLGVLLVQLPPSLEFDADSARRFFVSLRKKLPSNAAGVACEPRHLTWFSPEADAFLTKHQIARVAADPMRTGSAGEPGGWPGLIYYRLHGSPRMYYSNYDQVYLETLQLKLKRHVKSAPAWCIFDNTAEQAATANALTVAEGLSRPLATASVRRTP